MIQFFKTIIFFVIAIHFYAYSFSQCVVLNLNMGDCASCNRYITLLNEAKLSIPKYAVFSKNNQEDSLEIERLYKLSSYSYKLLFDDSLYALTRKAYHSSTLVLFNSKGQPYLYKDLRTVNSVFIQDTLVTLYPQELSKDIEIYSRSSDRIFIFDYDLGKIKIYSNKGHYITTIYSSAFPFDTLVNALKGEQKEFLKVFGKKSNFQAGNYPSKYKWIEADKEGNLFALFEYVSYEDTVNLKANTFYCMVKFDSDGQLVQINPIHFPKENSPFNDMFNHGGKDTLVILTNNYYKPFLIEKLGDNEDKRFVSMFVLKDGEYVFSEFYFPELPKIYNEKYHGNYLTLQASRFPYLAFQKDNKIYDLKSKKVVSIIDDNEFYSNVDFSNQDIKDDPNMFKVIKLDIDSKKNVHIVYMYKEIIYYHVYDKELNLLSSKSLEYLNKVLKPIYADINLVDNLLRIYGKQYDKQLLQLDLRIDML